MDPIDTGRYAPPGATPPFLPGSIPGGGATPPFNPTPGESSSLNVPPPAQPITRPSFLQSFLANLPSAMAGGLANNGDPRFPFGTGLPGALHGIAEADQLRKQNAIEQQNQARQNALAQSTLQSQADTRTYQTAETNRLNLTTPLDVQQKQLEIDSMKGTIQFYAQPGNLDAAVTTATGSLGKLSPNEQAQIDAAKKDAQINRKFDPINAAVKTISQDRITEARGADSSAFKDWRTQFIKERGRQPNTKEITDFQTAGQALRISGMENLRQDNYLDTSIPGGNVSTMTSGEFAAANKTEPGRFVKYSGQVANTLKAQSFISDIRDGMKQMQAAVDDPNFKLSSAGRAIMSVASKNPGTAISTVMSGLAANQLSDSEQNYMIAHASLLERSMSLRSLQGQGAGSDQQRAAIASLVPGLATGDKNMAGKLLKTLGNNVDNVEKAFPKIGSGGNNPPAGGPPAGATMRVPGSDGKMHWSDGKRDLGVIQ